jgi:hypothetical protein
MLQKNGEDTRVTQNTRRHLNKVLLDKRDVDFSLIHDSRIEPVTP